MHELPVTESVLEIALRHAKKADASNIKFINIKIGEYSSIIDDSIQFYWDIISKDTIAEGAILKFNRIPAKFLCLECDKEFKPGKSEFTCPYCKSNKVKLVQGNEFSLESIDIE